jgi:4-diphosphocytidyl-2-C-methyl-D-erythritol kinase
MIVDRLSPCKINLLLNILGRRPDGFHEVETVLYPIPFCDRLTFERQAQGIQLACDDPELPLNGANLVCRAAEAFRRTARIEGGFRINLEKRIPLAAGLGGGSSNAAATLLGLNDLFGKPLTDRQLVMLATELGADVPFFLQTQPALATGRGEQLEPLEFFPVLRNMWVLLVYPGFGVPTAWAYQQLAQFPEALHGQPGRGRGLIAALRGGDFCQAKAHFYNGLEAPVLRKYPLLALLQEFLRDQGAPVTLMSGSGSTTFALLPSRSIADQLIERCRMRFGRCWTTAAPLGYTGPSRRGAKISCGETPANCETPR